MIFIQNLVLYWRYKNEYRKWIPYQQSDENRVTNITIFQFGLHYFLKIGCGRAKTTLFQKRYAPKK